MEPTLTVLGTIPRLEQLDLRLQCIVIIQSKSVYFMSENQFKEIHKCIQV